MQSEDKNFEDLMIDYLSGNISESNQQYLSDLIKSNDNLKVRFNEMLKLRAISFVPVIEAEKQANYKKILEQINDTPTINISRTWMSGFKKIAAIITLIISVSVASFYIYKDLTSPADNTFCYQTFSPVGSQTKIILPDGTVVWLNSGSSLKYNRSFGKENREVALSGEGYFEVSKDKKKQFIVHTGMLDVNDIGTVFNVKAYKDEKEIIVNLIEGAVNISLPDTKKSVPLLMKPNEKSVFNKLTKRIELFETDASRSALWTTGRLCFVDATIEQISKDLERKYNVKIKIANEKIKKELFSGSLNLNLSLKEVLSYIDVDKKFKINQVGDTIFVGIKQQ
ncbi:MAG: FecR family protein [Paludibacter sp.]|nr:FecR family protein [Paludibacter sp.]